MKSSCYLTLTFKGTWKPLGVKASLKKPTTKGNEVAVKLEFDIPESLFQKPQLQALIKVDPSKSAPVIDATVIDNIAENIYQQLGLNVNITVEGVAGLDEKISIAENMG